VTYEKLVASGADVMILSDPGGTGFVYSAAEIAAIKKYAEEGHNILGTYVMLTPAGNEALAPLFGLRSDLGYTAQAAAAAPPIPYQMVNSNDPVFAGLSQPFMSSGYHLSQVPSNDLTWDDNDLDGARFLARTSDNKSAITFYAGKNHHAIYVSNMPEFTVSYGGSTQDIQFLYNALTYPEVLKAVTVRSWGCSNTSIAWSNLNDNWMEYGSTPIFIEIGNTELCNSATPDDQVYDQLVASGADVVILSDAAVVTPAYSAEEIAALKRYAEEGHNLLATYLTFGQSVDNRGLTPLFGINDQSLYGFAGVSPSYDQLNVPLFTKLFTDLVDPYPITNYFGSQVPTDDSTWDADDLAGARYIGLSPDRKAAITAYAAGNYTGVFVSGLPELSNQTADRQFLYNAIVFDLAQVYIPMLTNNLCGERPGGFETEPNNSFGQANGICIGVPVKGSPNDASPASEFDYFTFEWDAQGTLQVDLNNFVPDAQLILYKGTTELPGKDFTPGPGNSYQVTYGGAAGPGTYNVLVLAGAGHPTNTGDYTLTVTVK
jgi:hypothetical protein